MNFIRFEELNGIPLGMFVSDAIKRADVDDSILAWVPCVAGNWTAICLVSAL